MLPMVNRCAILLTPKQPYRDWANSIDTDGPRFEDTEDYENDTRPIFLGPDVEDPGDAARFVDKNFNVFFESWLEDWCTDESLWPRRRTRRMFREWFEVSMFEIVYDTIARPLEVEG